MPEFPLTFQYAGRTFSVVSDGDPRPVARRRVAGDGAELLYVRIVGVRGLHELGSLDPSESAAELTQRICRWYDEQLAVRS